jgi:hypothetical protein
MALRDRTSSGKVLRSSLSTTVLRFDLVSNSFTASISYPPTSPSFLQRLPVWVRVTERKADDFWGILGLLSRSIDRAE